MDFPGEKLVIKLWETLAEKGIGSLFSPWQVLRDGRALNKVRRDELLMLAQAEKDAEDIRAGKKHLNKDGTLSLTNSEEINTHKNTGRVEPILALHNIFEYGNQTTAYVNARSEINASKAILFAEEQLSNDTQAPPPRDIDEDWLFVWREYAGKVSAEDLQRLWGSVLAGEVKSPGKYSIRTLEFLKTLSKPEAEIISSLASYVIDGYIARNHKEYLESKGLTFSNLLIMQELGVISGVDAIGLKTTCKSVVKEKFQRAFVSHDKALLVEHNDPAKTLNFEIYLLTAVGREILSLGSFEPDIDYMKLVGQEFVKQGFKVYLADWHQISETSGKYSIGQEIIADIPST